MYCKNCGNKLEDNSKFCSNCGLQLNIENNNINEKQFIKDSEKMNKSKSEKVVLQCLFAVAIILGVISIMQDNVGAFMICLIATLFFAHLIDKINKENK